MLEAHDLSALIRHAGRPPWRARLDACLAEHLAPAAEQLDVDISEVIGLIGAEWEGPLWGCAFEDLLGRRFAGRTLADDWLRREGRFEPDATKAYIAALRDTPFALYEVGEVKPGTSMVLTSLLESHPPVTVRERSATRTLKPGDRIGTRLITGAGEPCISGALLRYAPETAAMLIDLIERTGATRDPELPFDTTDRVALLRHSAPLFTASWALDAAAPPAPVLVNTDGDAIEFHRVVWPLATDVTQKQVAALLDTHKALDRETAKVWNWLDTRRRKHPARAPEGAQMWSTTMEDGTPVLGTLELQGRHLIVEVNSARRAKTARKEIAALLGPLVRPPLTEIRTLAQAMADSDIGADETPDLPPAEHARIVHEMLDRHYRALLDEPIPALGDKTPRAAAKTAKGRREVAAWLAGIESSTASAPDPHMASYDARWLWAELGFAHPRET